MGRYLTAMLVTAAMGLAAPTTAVAHTSASHRGFRRTWRVDLRASKPLDYTIAQITFKASLRKLPHLSVAGPTGADYLTAGSVARQGSHGLRIVVFLLNRATDLMDPVSAPVMLDFRRPQPAPKTLTLIDVLAERSDPRAGLCDLTSKGRELSATEIHPMLAVGTPLRGYSNAQTLAEAYDLRCGLTFHTSFEQAIKTSQASPSPPAPAPPVPSSPPRCEPCRQPPGYACPLAARAVICIAPAPVTPSAGRASH